MLLLYTTALASPASFTRDFAGAVVRSFPECAAEPVGRLTVGVRCEGGDQLKLAVGRLYASCRADRATCGAERDAFLRGLDEALHPRPPTLDHVIPGVRPRSAVADLEGSPVLSEPFGGSLVVVYLVDSPTTMRYLKQDELVGLGVSAGDLLATTRPNVKAFAGDLDVQQKGPLLWVTGSVYTSSILFESAFWERLASAHGEVYAAAPARDVLLVLGTETEDVRAPELLRLAAQVVVVDPDTSGPLSSDVFHWKAGTWELVEAEGKPGR